MASGWYWRVAGFVLRPWQNINQLEVPLQVSKVGNIVGNKFKVNRFAKVARDILSCPAMPQFIFTCTTTFCGVQLKP
jgi:hypothetical protein